MDNENVVYVSVDDLNIEFVEWTLARVAASAAAFSNYIKPTLAAVCLVGLLFVKGPGALTSVGFGERNGGHDSVSSIDREMTMPRESVVVAKSQSEDVPMSAPQDIRTFAKILSLGQRVRGYDNLPD